MKCTHKSCAEEALYLIRLAGEPQPKALCWLHARRLAGVAAAMKVQATVSILGEAQA